MMDELLTRRNPNPFAQRLELHEPQVKHIAAAIRCNLNLDYG
jgi:hypothetical protein